MWDEEMPWLGQYVLDQDGNALPATGLMEWAQWMEESQEQRQIGHDDLGSWGWISTIFLGLDHDHLAVARGVDPLLHRPLLWETMVFGGPSDRYQQRYRSRDEALAGHRKIVRILKSGENLP